jgi:hypothetical protein
LGVGSLSMASSVGRIMQLGVIGARLVGRSRADEAEEHQRCTPQTDLVVVTKAPHAFAELRAEHGRDLVDHQPAGFSKLVGVVWFDHDLAPETIRSGLGASATLGSYRVAAEAP